MNSKLMATSWFIVLVVAAAAPSPVLAQMGGYYLEFSAGGTEARSEPIPPLTSRRQQVTESTANSTSYTLTGGWRFNDNFALEVNLTDHGSFSDRATLSDRLVVMERDHVAEQWIPNLVDAYMDADVKYDVRSYGVSMLGNWPLARRWNIYGRLGLASWETKSRVKGRLVYRGDLNQSWDLDGKVSDSGSSFFYGVGILYRFNRNYAAKLEYSQMQVGSKRFTSEPELGSFSFGLRYYF